MKRDFEKVQAKVSNGKTSILLWFVEGRKNEQQNRRSRRVYQSDEKSESRLNDNSWAFGRQSALSAVADLIFIR